MSCERIPNEPMENPTEDRIIVGESGMVYDLIQTPDLEKPSGYRLTVEVPTEYYIRPSEGE